MQTNRNLQQPVCAGMTTLFDDLEFGFLNLFVIWNLLFVSSTRFQSFHGAHIYGVYHIGDVYARSVTCIFVPAGIWTLKNFASYAVHRGVGISMTRT